MSLINDKKFPCLTWFDVGTKVDPRKHPITISGLAPGVLPGWFEDNFVWKSLLTFLMSDPFVGETFEQRLKSGVIDKKRRHLHRRYFLADAICKRIDGDPVLRDKLFPLIGEVPSEGGLLLFGAGGQYLYRICEETDSARLMAHPQVRYWLGKEGPPEGARWFMAAYLVRDVFVGYECGYLEPGVAGVRIIEPLSVYGADADAGMFLSFVGISLLFLRYAEIETKLVGPGQPRAVVNEEKYVNQSGHGVQIVDSRWFTTLIRSGAFGVKGHFRWQPFGEGRSGRRLQWINEFEKQGYVRKARLQPPEAGDQIPPPPGDSVTRAATGDSSGRPT